MRPRRRPGRPVRRLRAAGRTRSGVRPVPACPPAGVEQGSEHLSPGSADDLPDAFQVAAVDLARIADDHDALDPVDERDGVGVRQHRRGEHDDHGAGAVGLGHDPCDGRGGQGARHVVRGGPGHQGERAGSRHVHVASPARRPGTVALLRRPARRPDLVGGRSQVTGEGRGAEVGLHEQDVAAHLGEGGGQVDRRGGRRRVVPARGGDQEPAALRERRVVGEPEGHRPVLLGEPRTAAPDREQGARGGALPGQGAEQGRPEGADELPG
ncbi:hypothetical protein RKD45_005366 [Streptomyces griseus]